MGMSGSKTKTKSTQTNKPVYANEIKGAYNMLSGVYADQAPKIAGYADQIGGLVPGLIDRYQQGDPSINASRNYITDTLEGDGSNPFLDDMIGMSNDRTRNQVQASMGSRGQFGGSDYANMMTRTLAQNETGLRYNDYDREQQRRAQAASMSPSIAAGDLMTLSPALSAAGMASSLPMGAAGAYAGATGGLLGSYQNVNGTQTTKSSPGLMGILGMGLQGASMFLPGGNG